MSDVQEIDLALPDEVAWVASRMVAHYDARYLGIVFYPKEAWSRSAAWSDAVTGIGGITPDSNPFRKSHTEHFWVWARVRHREGPC